MKVNLWCCLFLLLASVAKAEEPTVWVSTIVRSYHVDRSAGYKEDNYGLGVEIKTGIKELRVVFGEYSNSIYKHSNYLGLAFLPLEPAPNWKIGLTAIIVTGYNVSPVLVGAPTIVYEYKRFGINLITAGVVSALEVKVGF